MISEFDLIKKYFTHGHPTHAVLGIGDDCALLMPAPGQQMAISSDMLVEGRHFFVGADARMLGHKCLAVNLSDLAAMGAAPVGFTLALALPQADPAWLAPFAEGLFLLANSTGCELIGGDTTRGPLTICITIFGQIAPGHALQRNAAQAGDDIWISGTLGDARLALALYRQELAPDRALLELAAPRMHTPSARNTLGRALAGGVGQARVAHAAIDISDGLTGDLGHILSASGCGATVNVDALPAGPALARMPIDLRRRYCAAGGDDYELCFTAPVSARAAVRAVSQISATPVTRVGSIEAGSGLHLVDAAGKPVALDVHGFDHFTSG